MGSRKNGVGKRKSERHACKATSCLSNYVARDAQSWTEIVTEGGRRFMAEWRKEEEEKSKTRQNNRTAK